MTTRATRRRLIAVALVALALPAAPLQAGMFTLTVGEYDSPAFTNINGTYHFKLFGRPDGFVTAPTITLTPGIPDTEFLDGSAIAFFDPAVPVASAGRDRLNP